MGLTGGLAIYFVLWWLAFLAVLPFGVRTIEETGEYESGQAQSAPSRPFLMRKIVAATALAALVWGAVYFIVTRTGLTLSDFTYAAPPNG